MKRLILILSLFCTAIFVSAQQSSPPALPTNLYTTPSTIGGSFASLAGGTNTSAAMVCGTGCSLATSGTGAITATPAGSNTQMQFNNNGAFGVTSGFTWNGTTLLVNPGGATGAIIIGQAGTGANSSLTIGGVSATASITNDGTAAADLTFSTPIKYPTTVFASIGAVPAAGIAKFCTDCTTAATCAGSGSGHLAVSNGTNWTCQ